VFGPKKNKYLQGGVKKVWTHNKSTARNITLQKEGVTAAGGSNEGNRRQNGGEQGDRKKRPRAQDRTQRANKRLKSWS